MGFVNNKAKGLQMQAAHFKCDMCGLCCRNLKLSKVYAHLDRGDGTCRHYDEKTHKCLIYANRPVICNIERYYREHLAKVIDKDKYFALNYEVCKKLKQGVLQNE